MAEIIGDMTRTFDVLDKLVGELVRANEKLTKVCARLDGVLDKPMNEDNPKYCCGDVLEEISCVLDKTAKQIPYTKELAIARAISWWQYDGTEEEDADRRSAFVNGYLAKK